jgi:DNA relaxase NicK
MIDLSGQYLEECQIVDCWRLIRGLYHAFNCYCCRIDIRIDDSSFQVIPTIDMFEACQNGNQFFLRCHESITDEDGNETIAFGSRKSEHYTRVYNHKNKHQRHETEFKGNLARRIFETIANLERDWFNNLSAKGSKIRFNEEFPVKPCHDELQEWLEKINLHTQVMSLKEFKKLASRCKDNFDLFLEKILGSIAVSSLDFRDRSIRKDKSKASCRETLRLDFYQKFVDKVTRIELKSRIKRVIKDWINRELEPPIAIVKDTWNDLNSQQRYQPLGDSS